MHITIYVHEFGRNVFDKVPRGLFVVKNSIPFSLGQIINVLWRNITNDRYLTIKWWNLYYLDLSRWIWFWCLGFLVLYFFCLFLTNYWYGSTSKHLELWLEVSKTLHKSINPVSCLFTITSIQTVKNTIFKVVVTPNRSNLLFFEFYLTIYIAAS